MRLLLILFLLFAPLLHAEVRFLSLTDIHYGADNTPGDGHNTDKTLLASALKKAEEVSRNVDFIMVLGDLPTNVLYYSPSKADYLKTVFHQLYQMDSTKKPMFFITGNNDSLGGNYQSFSSHHQTPLTFANDWQGACVYCDNLVIDKTHMAHDGYYSSYVIPNNKDILLIAINSTLFANHPLLTLSDPNQDRDAEEELAWLQQQLMAHRAKQLLIAMHIPPGIDYKGNVSWKEAYLAQFKQLLNKTSAHYNEITLLAGHTHMDEIRRVSLTPHKTIYTYVTPSVSRSHHNNPAMKRFELNNEGYIKDITTYYTTTDEPWENQSYSVINGNDSMFPQCHHHNTLTACLNTLSTSFLCHRIEQGEFYGVKSTRVTLPKTC